MRSTNLKQVLELLELMKEHSLEEVEFEQGDVRIKLRKSGSSSGGPQMIAAPMPMAHVPAAPPAVPLNPQAVPAPEAAAEPAEGTAEITSPMVGTFYRSPAPDADAFVSEGDAVSADSVVCIIEAMKVMNEIKAEMEGEVVKILVENGESVEYGQPLMVIRKHNPAE